MQAHHITIPKTARYFTEGELGTHTREIWIVLHGYGQLASTFLASLSGLYRADRYFIAPEGLSRFYLRGGWEEVGASWMTKEDRTTDILDYLRYIDILYDELAIASHGAKIVVLGFSQGVATATRWLHHNSRKAHTLILYAGEPAGEINTPEAMAALATTQRYYIYGKQDKMLTTDHAKSIMPLLAQYELLTFEGGHEINTDVLAGKLV
jgi:predicted esterase